MVDSNHQWSMLANSCWRARERSGGGVGGVITPSCPFQEFGVGNSGALPHWGLTVKVAAEEEDHFLSREVTLQINTLVLRDVASSSPSALVVFVHLLAVTMWLIFIFSRGHFGKIWGEWDPSGRSPNLTSTDPKKKKRKWKKGFQNKRGLWGRFFQDTRVKQNYWGGMFTPENCYMEWNERRQHL